MRRAALVALLLVMGEPTPALAHGTEGGGGGGGLSFPVLVGGLVLVGAGLAARARNGRPLVAWGPVVAGVVVAAASLFVGGGDTDRPDVHILVVEPKPPATVPAGESIAVRVAADGPIATDPSEKQGGHLHLSVDGALQQMPYATETKVTLEPGTHELTVEYVDNDHRSYDPPIQHTIEVTAT